jgi:predicted O-methyltransferase YrrM
MIVIDSDISKKIMREKAQMVIDELERKRADFWNVPFSTATLLAEVARVLGFCGNSPRLMLLEIGTSNGYSGIFLAEAAREFGGLLVTVESHAGRFEIARENFARAGVSDFVKQVKGHAPEVFYGDFEFDSGFDFIFLDATKMEYVSYLDAVLPLLNKRGLLVADNCLSHFSELSGFYDELEKRKGELSSMLLKKDNGLMFVRKI